MENNVKNRIGEYLKEKLEYEREKNCLDFEGVGHLLTRLDEFEEILKESENLFDEFFNLFEDALETGYEVEQTSIVKGENDLILLTFLVYAEVPEGLLSRYKKLGVRTQLNSGIEKGKITLPCSGNGFYITLKYTLKEFREFF